MGPQRARRVLRDLGIKVTEPTTRLTDRETAVVRRGLADGLTPQSANRLTGVDTDRTRRWRQQHANDY